MVVSHTLVTLVCSPGRILKGCNFRLPWSLEHSSGRVEEVELQTNGDLQNLVGIDLKARNSEGNELRVKDLPLYPLPIVRDNMSVYELLDLFQLGMSRYSRCSFGAHDIG